MTIYEKISSNRRTGNVLERYGNKEEENMTSFQGWWSEEEKEDEPDPWETFSIMLFGEQAGDTVAPEDVAEIMKLAKKRIVIENIVDPQEVLEQIYPIIDKFLCEFGGIKIPSNKLKSLIAMTIAVYIMKVQNAS